jgi:hypothetical protein
LGQVHPQTPSRGLHLTWIVQNRVRVVLFSRWDEYPALVEPCAVWLTSHHHESLEKDSLPIQNNEWCMLQLNIEGNLQIIQSLESVEPDSSTAGAVFRQANEKHMLPSKSNSCN